MRRFEEGFIGEGVAHGSAFWRAVFKVASREKIFF